jgi:hypothetical protein
MPKLIIRTVILGMVLVIGVSAVPADPSTWTAQVNAEWRAVDASSMYIAAGSALDMSRFVSFRQGCMK